MAYIVSQIAGKVRQRVRDTGYSPEETLNYINDTQNDVFNEYRLPFMEAVQPYTLDTSTSDITNGANLPDNFVQAIDLTLTTAGMEKNIPFVDIRSIDSMYPDPDDTATRPKGVPLVAYKYAQTIRVHPVPNSAYTVSLRYYKKPTILVADGDIPELPSEFEEVLVVGAAYRIMQVKDNYDQAAILQNKYDELLQKLTLKYSQTQVGTPTLMRINRHGPGKSHF